MSHRTALVLLAVGIVACTDRSEDADRAAGDVGGTIVFAIAGRFSPSTPPVIFDGYSRAVADLVYDRLADINANMNTLDDRTFTPRLAHSWTWAADSLSIAFHIDPRARWHDGQPVRASDVRFTFDVLKDPLTASPNAAPLANVDSITVRDSLTAVAWFHRRTPEQFYDVVYQIHVLPEHVLRDVPRNSFNTVDVNTAFIGSGPFRVAGFEPNVRLELVADTANYRGRPNLDRIVFSMSTDAGAGIAQFLTGQADVWENLPTELLPQVDSNPNVRAVPAPSLGYAFMEMNFRNARRNDAPHPIFSDRSVRRAISMALDRERMVRNVFGEMGEVGVGPFPGALADTTIQLPPFDRTAAAALLDSAGWRLGPDGVRERDGRPLAFNLLYPTSSKGRAQYAVLIQEQLRTVGIRVQLDAADIRTFLDRWSAETYDALMSAWNPDPGLAGIKQYWTTEGMGSGGANHLSYSNPAVDALIDSSLVELDPSRSRQLAHRAYQMIADDAPAVWLYDIVTPLGVHQRIRTSGLLANGWWMGLPSWWIPEAERIDRDRIGLRAAPAQP